MQRGPAWVLMLAVGVLLAASCGDGAEEKAPSAPVPTSTVTAAAEPVAKAVPATTPAPTSRPTAITTPAPTATQTPTPALTATASRTATPTPAPPATPTLTPTSMPSPRPTPTATHAPSTATPTLVPTSAPKADVIFFNGQLVTMDSDMTQAEALAVKDDSLVKTRFEEVPAI